MVTQISLQPQTLTAHETVTYKSCQCDSCCFQFLGFTSGSYLSSLIIRSRLFKCNSIEVPLTYDAVKYLVIFIISV